MTAPRLLLLVLAVLATAVAGASVLALVEARRPAPRVAVVAETPPRAESRAAAAAVLTAWDRRRAAAWAAGDARGLAGLYAPGSRTGRADVAMLRRWTARGLRVTDLRMQVIDVRARAAAGDRWELVVTDRLAGGEAVGRRTRAALPRDGWSTRRIVLRQVAGQWRVAEVRPARP